MANAVLRFCQGAESHLPFCALHLGARLILTSRQLGRLLIESTVIHD
jgi:hypothetical protein